MTRRPDARSVVRMSTLTNARSELTGFSGQTFQSAAFTLASTTQCQGGSPRFIVVTNTGLYPLGCNNVTPVENANGTATYTFTAATLAAAGQQVPTPTGTISFVSVLIDVQGTADLTKITFNGVVQKALTNKAEGAFAVRVDGFNVIAPGWNGCADDCGATPIIRSPSP